MNGFRRFVFALKVLVFSSSVFRVKPGKNLGLAFGLLTFLCFSWWGFNNFIWATSRFGYLVAIGIFVGGFLSLCLLMSAGGFFLLNQQGIGFGFFDCSKLSEKDVKV